MRSIVLKFNTRLILLFAIGLLAGTDIKTYGQSYTISTFAGTGSNGTPNGDGGPAKAAIIRPPSAVAFDTSGNLYIATENSVRKVGPDGIISTFAGTGVAGYSGDGGAATLAQLSGTFGLAIDVVGNVYIADQKNNCVRKVNPGGIISTIAGTGTAGYSGDGGPATSATLNQPCAIAIDKLGNIYISDEYNHRVRKMNASGIISNFAGDGTYPPNGDGGPASTAAIDVCRGIAIDSAGNIYLAGGAQDRIRKVDTNGIITTICGFSGSATGNGFSGDGGPAVLAKLNSPCGLTFDRTGNMYIADGLNERIRKIDRNGIITTIAGNGYFNGGFGGYSGDGGPALAAMLGSPDGVAVDINGDIYISDWANLRVRKLTLDCTTPPNAGFISANPDSVCRGNYSRLTVSGSSGNIQWQFSSDGISFTNIAGASLATYNTSDLTQTAWYRIKVNTACGIDSSGITKVQLIPSPVTGSLSAVKDTICQGTLARVTLAGNSGAAQWQSSVSLSGGFSTITAVTGNSYTTTLNQTTYYRIIVSNGQCVDTSALFTEYVAPAPVAAFSISDSGFTSSFNSDSSKDANYYTWDFGDNTTSTQANPVHTFNKAGTYHVCLTVQNKTNCNFTLCQNVIITGINSIQELSAFKIYPIPFNDELVIEGNELNQIKQVEIFDVTGRSVLHSYPGPNTSGRLGRASGAGTPRSIGEGQVVRLNVATLSNGIYFLKIKTNNTDYTQKVIKQ